MSRIINLNSPGKLRNQLMRTSAEMLSRLGQKSELDDESRDMVSLLVYSLREIDNGIDRSVLAWEKRDYWIKAERFRVRWDWVRRYADELETIIRSDDWGQLPLVMVQLLPYFEHIKVVKFTRSPRLWQGVYQRLIQEDRTEEAH